MWYIWAGTYSTPPNFAYSGFLQFWSYIIIFTNFIPISLLVTLDMVKFFQGIMMMFDLNMYYETKDNDGNTVEIPMQVRSSDLNEELGVIEHVFRYVHLAGLFPQWFFLIMAISNQSMVQRQDGDFDLQCHGVQQMQYRGHFLRPGAHANRPGLA